MKREDLEKVVYAQGWISNQMEKFVPPAEETEIYERWKQMWYSLDKLIDALVQDSLAHDQLKEKLAAIKSLTRTPVEEKLEQIGQILS